MKAETERWIGHMLDWVSGVEPLCPALGEDGHVPVAAEAAAVRRGATGDPYLATMSMAAQGVARPGGIRTLIIAANEGDRDAWAALGKIIEWEIEVVEDHPAHS